MGYFRPLSQTKYINDANLLTYWKLEDTSDSKGSMTLTNKGTTTFTSGKFDNAANFGATNTTKGLYASQTSNTTFTVSLWVNYSAWNAGQALIDKYPSGGWRINGGTTWNGLLLSFDATNWVLSFTPTIGQWYHIVMTFNNSTGTALTYIDGILRDTKTGLTLTDSTANITLGVANNLTTYFLSGLLDDTAIFSRVLSASEVADLYQGMTLGEYLGDTTAQFELQNTDLRNDSALVSYWRMEGNSNDSKGTNNGTDTSITYVPGRFGSAASFNGSSSKIVTGNNVGLDGSTASISLWFKPAAQPATGNYFDIFVTYNSTTDIGFILRYYDTGGTKKMYMARRGYNASDGPVVDVNQTLTNGTWYHLVLTYNTTGTILYAYVNGSSIGNNSTAFTGTPSGASNETAIGCEPAGVRFTNGQIDDVAVFNKALSLSEVQSLYRTGSTKLLLHLNGNSTDSSGNGNNGTDTVITYVDGKFGKCASGNTTTSNINLGNSASLGITGDMTISCWRKFNDFTTYNSIISKTTSAGRPAPYDAWTEITTGVLATYWGGSGATDLQVRTNSAVPVNEMINIVITKSGTTVKIYINAKEQAVTTSGSSTMANGTDNVYVGYRTDGVTKFNGLIDEFIIENIAWSAEKVKKYYTYAKGRFGII